MVSDGTPQTVSLLWRDHGFERTLAGAANVYDGGGDCLCDVLIVTPPLTLPWRYTAKQVAEGRVWSCSAVWLLDRTVPPRRKEETYTALEKALNTIARDKDRVRWSLLVNSDGMSYSRLRVGGDHNVSVDGRHFTFSVRKHALEGQLCLLAVHH
jgi:hypothetical protein